MVYVYSSKLQRRLEFQESVVDALGFEDETPIKIRQDSCNLVVGTDCLGFEWIDIPLCRPRVCPFAMSNRRFLDSYGKSCPKWIPVACCCLLHLSGLDGLFLTRRPWHMRSYPGVWVPPGGHCEAKEPIQDTAFRELTEELGLHSYGKENVMNECTIKPLCAWEASYPSRLDTGIGKSTIFPKSHHMVIYYSVNWFRSSTSVLDSDDIHSYLPQFNLEVNEVCAAVWLPRPVLNKLSDDWKAFEKHFQNQSTISNSEYLYPELSTMPSTFQIDNDQTEVWYWGVNSLDWQSVPVNQLICGLTSSRNPTVSHNTRPESEVGNGPSPVTLGTLYAISHWLSSTSARSTV
ncbi:Nucleoside diphosphate-linked moiety X motif 17, variant 2 [Schistosoma haematobium]|uniref:Nucleoside diphosphate-linked moiety X motif 17, variant 2 n=4 Tax=Schistosoma TaxID=6181 RepID=A0A6A5DJ30_SCHHA|nr:Nucleoside diphosphate-linked moiety X motif 17, variant 2 [Schistosoma haematobium]KAH9592147.1 Nucleoside diphosphate-linked moiety X motif 17, variant 2 [Schistosoma haematobium]CAH8675688.1 unnamed protein product [Schistosoma haematobium]